MNDVSRIAGSSATSMKSRRILFALLSLVALDGALAGYRSALHAKASGAEDAAFTVAMVVGIYLWYYLDAAERQYKRTTAMGGAVILFSFMAVPFYLFRSRPPGQRRKALARFLGFCLLYVIVGMGAAISSSWIAQEAGMSVGVRLPPASFAQDS